MRRIGGALRFKMKFSAIKFPQGSAPHALAPPTGEALGKISLPGRSPGPSEL